MADTIVNTPANSTGESAVGWAVAAVVVVAIIVGALLLMRSGFPGVPNTGTMDVKVELPAGSTGGTGTNNGGGDTGGATQ